MSKLKRIFLNGFKSFRFAGRGMNEAQQMASGNAIEFGDITVLLGANGAGKSNIVSFFNMLSRCMAGSLQEYVGKSGGSPSLLHYGPKVTPDMMTTVELENDDGLMRRYEMIISHVPPDALMFVDERVISADKEVNDLQTRFIQSGPKESGLPALSRENTVFNGVYSLLSGCRTYQFHDTSISAPLRIPSYVEDVRYLMRDGGNLAAYLYVMRTSKDERRYYDRIVRTIQQVYPQFKDFDLAPNSPNGKNVTLNWREQGNSEYLFGPHQLSDGTLRFMALATLFLQPPEKLPSVIVVDEPELGLHPYAITVLAGLIHGVSDKCQVVVSTQSARLVDEFDVSQIVVVERDRKENYSFCHRPDPVALADWIKDYSTSELWDKNVLGGRP